jgi:hypothetical protein
VVGVFVGDVDPGRARPVKARKCGITLLFLTQSPTAASIPKDLTCNCSNGVAFAVADQVANDAVPHMRAGTYRRLPPRHAKGVTARTRKRERGCE